MDTAAAVQKFTADPGKFLEKNCVIIAGGAKRPSGPTIFIMDKGTTKVMRKKNPLPFWTVNISNKYGGNPGSGVSLAPEEFVAFYIPMKQMDDSVANVFGMPPSDGSIDLLLTSQLTGCTFGFSRLGGQFLASHLQPKGGVDPKVSRQRMADITQAGMSGGGRLLQKGVDYKDVATVVGKFENGEWKVYMQRIDWNPGDGKTGFKEVVGITTL